MKTKSHKKSNKTKLTKRLNREYLQIDTPTQGQFWVYRRSQHRYGTINRYFDDLYDTLGSPIGGGTVVQAGAYVGIYPIRFAEHFDFVHTFEADKYNYELARRNIELSNLTSKIKLHKAALGETEGHFQLQEVKSTVSHYMTSVPGKVHQIAIDSLGLDNCSLIQLDIEGAEWPALKGAEETISKFRPALVLEMKNHGINKGFSYTEEEMVAWLLERGYHKVAKTHSDVIFKAA